MRTNTMRWLTIFTLPLLGAGCFESLCDLTECVEDGGAGAAGAGGEGGDGVGGNAGGEGGGGAPPVGCEPAEGEPIGPDCGVFVQAGEAGNGSQTSPYGSVTEAVANIGGATRIYICGGESFTGSIQLASDISVYGSLDCASWRFQSANPRPEIVGTADEPAVTISGSGAGELMFLRVRGADANAAGSSSIAVMVIDAETTIQDCELVAGTGATGVSGEPQAKAMTPVAASGGSGDNGCGGTFNNPGLSGLNTCASTNVQGGLGGIGTNAVAGTGGDAGDGQPLGPLGQGGVGELVLGAGQPCTTGGVGATGTAGTPGGGATASDQGMLTADGYQAPTAPAGATAGAFGQGGGGGGGRQRLRRCGPRRRRRRCWRLRRQPWQWRAGRRR